jgi:hypothetical protein
VDGSTVQQLEPYVRHDPLSGQTRTYFRVSHNTIRSARLQAYLRCVSGALKGRHYRGQGAAVDEANVRRALAEASRTCAHRLPASPPTNSPG